MKIIAVILKTAGGEQAKPDLAAVEAALRVKKQTGASAEVTALCVGTQENISLLREAVAMGCDNAVLFHLPSCYDTAPEPSLYARMISRALEDLEYDAVFTSCYAVDADAIQTGFQLAANLNIPFAGYAEEVSYSDEQGFVVKRMFEDRYQMLKLPSPCLISALLQPGKRIYMTAGGITRAYSMEIPILHFKDGIDEMISYITLLKSQIRKERSRGTVLTVPTEEAVAAVLGIMRKNHII